jgi:hypothetical protein
VACRIVARNSPDKRDGVMRIIIPPQAPSGRKYIEGAIGSLVRPVLDAPQVCRNDHKKY